MQQSHGLSYAEYNQNLEKRIEVEKEREKEYRKCNKIAAEFN